jgi:thiosulfate/3-mercaptopyruvate sulfurtransferase
MRSSSLRVPRRAILAGALSVGLAACKKGDDAATEASIGPLLAPAALASRVDDIATGKIAVLYVGPDALFGRGHVPGARNVGAVDSDRGRRALSEALAAIPAETDIVLYCGCCPVRSCPNIRPASAAIRTLGRANAHVLDLPTRFSTDWSDKGYPVERS